MSQNLSKEIMQILLASAKIMREGCRCGGIAAKRPLFEDVAASFAADLSHMTVDEIADAFSCSMKIAQMNLDRYKIFGTDEAELTPAIFAYFGQAYKHLKADGLSAEEYPFRQSHSCIS